MAQGAKEVSLQENNNKLYIKIMDFLLKFLKSQSSKKVHQLHFFEKNAIAFFC
jgi:hypothetical protein